MTTDRNGSQSRQHGVHGLRICHVLDAFPVLSETFVSNEVRALRARGHTVIPLALAPYPGPCQPQDEPFRAETIALRSIPAAAALARATWPSRNLRRALRFIGLQNGLPRRSLLLAGARVALAARHHGIQHLHAHFALASAAAAIVAARLAGLTVSFIGHGHDIYASRADLALKLAEADLVFATCVRMSEDMLALCPAARVRVTHCGIDPQSFTPQPDVASNGRLLAIGRLAPQKGYDALIRAISSIPIPERPVIDAVGAGSLREVLQGLAANHGVQDHLRFLGPLPSAWIAEHGPRYHGFVAPYVIAENGERDSSPMAIKEAMAMGLPVVGTDVMGIPEIVSPESGRLVTAGDVPALADALRWLRGLDAAARRGIGEAGRRRIAAHFSLNGQIETMVAAIHATRSAKGLA